MTGKCLSVYPKRVSHSESFCLLWVVLFYIGVIENWANISYHDFLDIDCTSFVDKLWNISNDYNLQSLICLSWWVTQSEFFKQNKRIASRVIWLILEYGIGVSNTCIQYPAQKDMNRVDNANIRLLKSVSIN